MYFLGVIAKNALSLRLNVGDSGKEEATCVRGGLANTDRF
jgi:hypothetical protein